MLWLRFTWLEKHNWLGINEQPQKVTDLCFHGYNYKNSAKGVKVQGCVDPSILWLYKTL